MDQSHSSLCVSSWHLGNPFTAGDAPVFDVSLPTTPECHCTIPLGCSQVLCITTRQKTPREIQEEAKPARRLVTCLTMSI
ncbi:hypothetical protein KIPB_008984 [Kipferlia bialata]|uniref:Uncharacterized protein n=1 Tax=Kipferlia bialata TaxID=797122 RepID=A0A9K3GLS3_9EUKA|nr:hypothetical protein KIPB_008984 [Kipferlia bialata]|eukprot:g8984.t1